MHIAQIYIFCTSGSQLHKSYFGSSPIQADNSQNYYNKPLLHLYWWGGGGGSEAELFLVLMADFGLWFTCGCRYISTDYAIQRTP